MPALAKKPTRAADSEMNRPLSQLPAPEGWPADVHPDAYHGLMGRIVRAFTGITESDPHAILMQTLIGFGNMIGRRAHLRIDGSRHFMNNYAVLVGESARARKGTSWSRTKEILSRGDAEWMAKRIESGLSSGEGLIEAVRDADDSKAAATDKRLMVIESEFASVLKAAARQGNILSIVIRNAWDDGPLQVLTRSPTRATDAHISVIGHITREELRECLTRTEQANGFGNRFLWCSVRRRLLLAHGAPKPPDLEPILQDFARAVINAKAIDEITMTPEARDLWENLYAELSTDTPGIVGGMTNRAEAHTQRIAAQYALLDSSAKVRPEHLRAALAVWHYCEASVRYIFGHKIGTPIGDTILAYLRKHTEGATRTQLRDLFNGHEKREAVDNILQSLLMKRLLDCRKEQTSGRPREVWTIGDNGGPPAAPSELGTGLRAMQETFDDKAAAILWQQARTREPDITPEELLHFVSLQMPAVRTGRIHSPVPFITHAVSTLLESRALADYRAKMRPAPADLGTLEEQIDRCYSMLSMYREADTSDPHTAEIVRQNREATEARLKELERERDSCAKRGKKRQKDTLA